MLTNQYIRSKALECGADIVGFGDIQNYVNTSAQRDPRHILPNARSVLGFAFRVPRALYETAERGYQYINLTSFAVKLIDEELSEIFLLKMAAFIENEGYDACVQRRVSNLRIKGDKTQNPEVTDTYELEYAEPVAPDRPAPEVIIDFNEAARVCGMGMAGLTGSVLTPRFGPFQRFVFIITDMPLEAYDAPVTEGLCDKCMACARACNGRAISASGLDTWQCSVYYRGAHRSNPYITPDTLKNNARREDILNGDMRFDAVSARGIYPEISFLPSRLTGYAPIMCHKACDLACYRHLKECGKL